MSIHGIQKFIPFVIDANHKILDNPVDFVIGLKNCLEQKKNNERVKNISRLAWPLILIHGTTTSHLIIDDVGICNLQTKITNPPRQAIIGHILRNSDNQTYNEMLDHIMNIVMYTESGKSISSAEVKEEEREEFQDIFIKGLVGPELINGIGIVIKKLIEDSISEYSLLESKLSVEIGLELAEKYKECIVLIKANKVRWESLIELIKGPFNEWINTLNVQIKDTELRFKTTITKEESNITEGEVRKLLKTEADIIDQWMLQEKKIILEKIGGSFLPINKLLEELMEGNNKFINTDSFKTIQIEKAVIMAKKQMELLSENIERYKEKLEYQKSTMKVLLEELKNIDNSAKERLSKKELELKTQLAQRNTRIQTISSASENYITDLKEAKSGLIKKLEEIKKIIEQKMDSCDKDLQFFMEYGLSDKVSSISQTVLRIFMPVFACLLEDSQGEERFVFSFPTILEKDLNCKALSDGMRALQQKTEQIVAEDMKIRSNFEFTIEKNNLLKDNKLKNLVINGLSVLKSLNYLKSGQEDFIMKYLEEISSN